MGTRRRRVGLENRIRAHLCIGQTIDQGRVWDIAAVGRHLNGDGPIKVIGRGQAGILGVYAALFEPSIREVVVVAPPASHAEGPNLPERTQGPRSNGPARSMNPPAPTNLRRL